VRDVCSAPMGLPVERYLCAAMETEVDVRAKPKAMSSPTSPRRRSRMTVRLVAAPLALAVAIVSVGCHESTRCGECERDERACDGDNVVQCVVDDDGCALWDIEQTCRFYCEDYGDGPQCYDSGHSANCSLGETRCADNTLMVCRQHPLDYGIDFVSQERCSDSGMVCVEDESGAHCE